MTLTSNLLSQILSDVKTDLDPLFTHGAIGTSATAATAADTELYSEIVRNPRDALDTSVSNAVTASLVISATQGNGSTIRETGWFNNAEGTVDNCDATTGWTDSADMTVSQNVTTFYQGVASLNLTKDAGASATASTVKTVTSQDFTNKNLSLILYVVDAAALAKLAATGCVTIRYGSDSSNYYVWTYDLTDLTVGKNVLNALDSTNADSTTGTPVLATMTYFYIGLTATGAAITWSAGDILMDDIKVQGPTLYSRNTPNAIPKTDSIILYLDTTITISVTEV
jgi:hypothetical protein